MNIVVLAAGKGKRMFSSLPKVLQLLAGKPLLAWVLDTVEKIPNKNKTVVVIGHGAEQVKAVFADRNVIFAVQEEQKGTAHALAQSLPFIDVNQSTLVLYGDVPLVSAATLNNLIKLPGENLGLLTVELEDPTGYGRIIREKGRVVGIVEEKDATNEQRKIKEINTGIMLLPGKKLKTWLSEVKCNNNQNEYYLTDLIGFAVRDGVSVEPVSTTDHWEVEGINDRLQLNAMERVVQIKQAEDLLRAGVRLADKNRIDIRGELTCGKDVFIDVGCVFEGKVTLADNVQVGPYCVIKDAAIGRGTRLEAFCHIDQAEISENAVIGPYARLRPGATLRNNVHVGNFVEIKKSEIGDGSKVNHLSYIGDCTMGSGVNIGAGTITCNYDGANKFRTVIEDNCFIGSDTQFVAPVTIHEGATVGAGATVTKDVPPNTLMVRRAETKIIKGWQRPIRKK